MDPFPNQQFWPLHFNVWHYLDQTEDDMGIFKHWERNLCRCCVFTFKKKHLKMLKKLSNELTFSKSWPLTNRPGPSHPFSASSKIILNWFSFIYGVINYSMMKITQTQKIEYFLLTFCSSYFVFRNHNFLHLKHRLITSLVFLWIGSLYDF